MSRIKISEAAALLGVSDDTVRRWITAGELPATGGEGVTTVDGAALAEL
ncbi:MAG: helix-turn-helix domain-containing protein, partial [Gordonia amarae]